MFVSRPPTRVINKISCLDWTSWTIHVTIQLKKNKNKTFLVFLQRVRETDILLNMALCLLLGSGESRTFHRGGGELKSCFSDSLHNQPNFSKRGAGTPGPPGSSYTRELFNELDYLWGSFTVGLVSWTDLYFIHGALFVGWDSYFIVPSCIKEEVCYNWKFVQNWNLSIHVSTNKVNLLFPLIAISV